jgi:fatty acid desaturase
MNWRSKLPPDFFIASAKHSVVAITYTWFCIVALWILCAIYWIPMIVIPAVVLIGTLQYHLNILGHDGIHYLLFPNRRLNDSICRWLLHAPQGLPLYVMRRNHFHHHRHLGDPSDTDAQYYDLSRFRNRSEFARWLISAPVGGMTFPIARKLMSSRAPETKLPGSAKIGNESEYRTNRLDWATVGLVQFSIFLITFLITGSILAYLVLWLAPLLTLMTGLNAIRSCLEHASWRNSAPEQRLFSFRSNAVERFFLAPFNMNYHAEHHLVPAVPYRQLPALRSWLTENGMLLNYEIKKSYIQQVCDVYRNW